MTSEEIVKFPQELEKALPVNYRVLLMEVHSGPVESLVVVHLRIRAADGRVFETNIPFSEFQAPVGYLIGRIRDDLRQIM